jgi:hypothetical protein
MFHPYFKKEESCSQHPQSILDFYSVHAFGVLLRRYFFSTQFMMHDMKDIKERLSTLTSVLLVV